MSCHEFDRYLHGHISKHDFLAHSASCTVCRNDKELDDRLLALAQSLRQSELPNPVLWQNIKDRLPQKPVRPSSWAWVWRIAAVILLCATAAFYYWQHLPAPTKGLLADRALQKVEAKERDYMQAIDDLEKAAQPQWAALPVDLQSLYRDRLQAIDGQIRRCREALTGNPANAHIRRYLLAALQDKAATLQLVAAFAKG